MTALAGLTLYTQTRTHNNRPTLYQLRRHRQITTRRQLAIKARNNLPRGRLWYYYTWSIRDFLCTYSCDHHTGIYRVNIKKYPPTTFVDIRAIRGDFCMKFYRTVKQSNIHCITQFGWNLLESDKLMLFQWTRSQPPHFSALRALSSRVVCWWLWK